MARRPDLKNLVATFRQFAKDIYGINAKMEVFTAERQAGRLLVDAIDEGACGAAKWAGFRLAVADAAAQRATIYANQTVIVPTDPNCGMVRFRKAFATKLGTDYTTPATTKKSISVPIGLDPEPNYTAALMAGAGWVEQNAEAIGVTLKHKPDGNWYANVALEMLADAFEGAKPEAAERTTPPTSEVTPADASRPSKPKGKQSGWVYTDERDNGIQNACGGSTPLNVLSAMRGRMEWAEGGRELPGRLRNVSQPQLAEDVGCDQGTVSRAIAKLRERGFVREDKPGYKNQRDAEYTVVAHWHPNDPPFVPPDSRYRGQGQGALMRQRINSDAPAHENTDELMRQRISSDALAHTYPVPNSNTQPHQPGEGDEDSSSSRKDRKQPSSDSQRIRSMLESAGIFSFHDFSEGLSKQGYQPLRVAVLVASVVLSSPDDDRLPNLIGKRINGELKEPRPDLGPVDNPAIALLQKAKLTTGTTPSTLSLVSPFPVGWLKQIIGARGSNRAMKEGVWDDDRRPYGKWDQSAVAVREDR